MESPFDLIETLRFDPDDGLVDLARHMARLRASAAEFGFAFDAHGTANELQAACFRWRTEARVRLRLAKGGAVAIEVSPLPEALGEIAVAIVPLPVAAHDLRLRHKTSDRAFYDEARMAARTTEILFSLPDGRLTEGSFTTVFVPLDDARLATPPLDCGLLPGVLRAKLIDEGRAIERDLTVADLARPFYVGNALRGLIPARLSQG